MMVVDEKIPAVAREAANRRLEAEAQQWVGLVNAATAQLVRVLAEALATGAWQGWGINSAAHWAGVRFGLSPARARRLVAAAEALVALPPVAEAFEAGELSEDHVAVIARAVPSQHDAAKVVELARNATVGQLRHALRGLPRADAEPAEDPPPGPDAEPATEPSIGDDVQPDSESELVPEAPVEAVRSWCGSWIGDDDVWRLRASGSVTDGAIVDKALRAAGDRLFAERHGEDADPALRNDISSFDALVYLCRVGLDAIDPATAKHPGRSPSERFVVNLHVNPARPDGGRVHMGPVVPQHLRHEATCDAVRRLWIEDDDGNVNLGRAARVVDARLRLVLEERDGGCRYPGCGRTKGLVAHHLVHWEHGGPTDTENLLMLCREHHRGVHHRHFTIRGNPNRPLGHRDALAFSAPGGRRIGPLPPQPPQGPVPDAARRAGMRDPGWRNRSGEACDYRLIIWHDPRRDEWLAQHHHN